MRDGVTGSAAYFFGLHNVDWSPIFLEMLSRKTDKLLIDNRFFPNFLTEETAEFLKEVSGIFISTNLPEFQHIPLLGKKIWFEATSNVNLGGFVYTDLNNEYTHNHRIIGSVYRF